MSEASSTARQQKQAALEETVQMAIEWRLADLMAQQGMNYKMLGAATGMHPNTISKLKHNPPARLEMVTLIRLCRALHCQPGELLIYIPEQPVPEQPEREVAKLAAQTPSARKPEVQQPEPAQSSKRYGEPEEV